MRGKQLLSSLVNFQAIDYEEYSLYINCCLTHVKTLKFKIQNIQSLNC